MQIQINEFAFNITILSSLRNLEKGCSFSCRITIVIGLSIKYERNNRKLAHSFEDFNERKYLHSYGIKLNSIHPLQLNTMNLIINPFCKIHPRVFLLSDIWNDCKCLQRIIALKVVPGKINIKIFCVGSQLRDEW